MIPIMRQFLSYSIFHKKNAKNNNNRNVLCEDGPKEPVSCLGFCYKHLLQDNNSVMMLLSISMGKKKIPFHCII